jgi:hypothetical protein
MIIHILIYTYMCMLKYIDAIIIIITITVIIIMIFIFIFFRRARDFEIQRLKDVAEKDRIQEENVKKQRLLDEKNEIQRYLLYTHTYAYVCVYMYIYVYIYKLYTPMYIFNYIHKFVCIYRYVFFNVFI